MDNSTTCVDIFGNSTDECLAPLLWDQSARESRYSRLYVCIIACFVHGVFWLQLAFCSSVRQSSMQWIYAYLITDAFVLARFFIVYIVRTVSKECNPSQTWILFICYFEATVDNYLNVTEVYILLALNVCRYIQIAYNKNVYRLYKKQLFLTHIAIYLPSIAIFAVPYVFGWSILMPYVKDRCETSYSNIYIQIFNLIFTFGLPIILNIFVIYLSIKHVHLASTLQRSQHHVSARQKYHRSLVIQFLIFYTIWLSLWGPNIIVYQISYNSASLTATVRLVNFVEVALDPIIIAALDVRFWQAWRQVLTTTKNSLIRNRTLQGRIRPSATAPRVFSIKTEQAQTTGV